MRAHGHGDKDSRMEVTRRPDALPKASVKGRSRGLQSRGDGGLLGGFMSSAPVSENAIISTAYGDMTLAFWPDVAPKTVENFKKLAREGFYDGTAFHRIIKGFMIQGGCPNTKAGAKGMPGTGDPGYRLKAEFNSKPHVRGVISMARASDPNSAGCQFFICHGEARFLDKQYTAFGALIAGDDVLERIATVPTKSGGGGEKSTPIDRVEVKSITIVAA